VLVIKIGDDQIAGMCVIELVDLISPFQHREVPFEEIDKDAFARREHGAECSVADAAGAGVDE
jgi:hypothetical protein